MLIGVASALAQQASTTSGACSPIAANNKGSITIRCQGISDKLGAQLIDILNRVAKNQIDADAVMKKLDACLEASVPRTISDSDAKKLAFLLLPFKGQKVSVSFISSDNETARLAKRLQSILRDAQWDVPADLGSMMAFGTGPLLGIEVAAKQESPAANAILNGLHAILPDVFGHLRLGNKDDTISITVYSKK